MARRPFRLRRQPITFRSYRGKFGGSDILVCITLTCIGIASALLLNDKDSEQTVQWALNTPLALLGVYQFTALVVLLVHHLTNRHHYEVRYHLADMPWKRAWPWVLTCLLGPLGWLIMLFSVCRLDTNRFHYIVADEFEAMRAESRAAREFANDNIVPAIRRRTDHTRSKITSSQLPSYISQADDCSEQYADLRINGAEHARNREIEALTNTIEYLTTRLVALGAEIKEYQDDRNQVRAKKAALEAMRPLDSAIDKTTATEEFERMIQLPGVIAVYAERGRIRLVVRASHEHNGVRYDLGDWAIDIFPGMTDLEAYELRDATRPGWAKGRYPSYWLSSGTFCLGGRHGQINRHLTDGDYLEAVALTVDCLNNVNHGDEHRLPEAFYPYADSSGDLMTALPTDRS